MDHKHILELIESAKGFSLDDFKSVIGDLIDHSDQQNEYDQEQIQESLRNISRRNGQKILMQSLLECRIATEK